MVSTNQEKIEAVIVMPLQRLTPQTLDEVDQVLPGLLLELVLRRAKHLLEDLHQLRSKLMHELLDLGILNIIYNLC